MLLQPGPVAATDVWWLYKNVNKIGRALGANSFSYNRDNAQSGTHVSVIPSGVFLCVCRFKATGDNHKRSEGPLHLLVEGGVMEVDKHMSVASHRFDNAKRRRPEHHARQAMLTPAYVLEPVRRLLNGIELDPCTEPDNPTGADRFYHLPMDGCSLPWDASSVFCNPPYGEARDRWVSKCIEVGKNGTQVVLLIPAHTETRIFQRALIACTSVLLVRARLRFGVLRENRRQEAASHGSAIFGFGVNVAPLQSLGTVVRKVRG